MDSGRNQPLINNNYPRNFPHNQALENNQVGWTPPPPPPQNQGWSNNPNPGYNPNYPPQPNNYPMNNPGNQGILIIKIDRLQQQHATTQLHGPTTNDARSTTNAKFESR